MAIAEAVKSGKKLKFSIAKISEKKFFPPFTIVKDAFLRLFAYRVYDIIDDGGEK